ncbi:hypothetical protein D3C75_557870 [compost metagenome]
MQPVLGVGRDLREVDGTDEPEPRVADDRARHRRRLPQAHAQDRPRLPEDVPVQRHLRRSGSGPRDPAAGQVTEHGGADHATSHHGGIAVSRHHHPGADGAGEDGQEGTGFHQPVAADQFFLAQGLRQDRVLHRAEQRRVSPHAEQRHQHQRQVVGDEAERAYRHDRDLGQLDGPDQRILGELLAKLPAQRRKQEERQDEQQGAQVDPDRTVTVAQAELEQDRQDQRLLEQVVVEGTQRLGDEKRQETPLAEQGELRGMTHRPWS